MTSIYIVVAVVVVVIIVSEKFCKSTASFLFNSLSQIAKNEEKVMVERLYPGNIGKVAVCTDEKILLKDELPSGLSRQLIPKHVAVIMDGNRRWAKKKGVPSMYGHQAGAQAIINLVTICCNWGIKVLTVFAFSSENWIRPQMEVDFLMKLFERILQEEQDNFMRNSVRLSVIGDSKKLPSSLQGWIMKATDATKDNSRLHLIMAIDYSGRKDIVQACQSISSKVKDGLIKPEDISETLINQELLTNCTEFPYPDFLVRTSGELRMSNFLMWQLAYTELYFDESLWPDFGEKEFAMALRSFQGRQRRFGGNTKENFADEIQNDLAS